MTRIRLNEDSDETQPGLRPEPKENHETNEAPSAACGRNQIKLNPTDGVATQESFLCVFALLRELIPPTR
jgi:hypothetical protein